MSEPKKGELEMRDKAILHQQRRLKQATQFTHKDSADLLPLDGLKRLGTSKDLQPHCIVQRRLLEGNIPRLRGEARDTSERVRSPLADSKEGAEPEEKSESTADDSTEERESPEESERSLRSEEEEEEEEEEEAGKALSKSDGRWQSEKAANKKSDAGRRDESLRMEERKTATTLTALVVQCKCCDKEVKASINTSCQVNRISYTCCRRLGLMPTPEGQKEHSCPVTTLPPTVKDLHLQLGKGRVRCSAHVVEEDVFDLCLGLQTLLELKCCVDLHGRVLRIHGSGEELPFLETYMESLCHPDNNKNPTM
ncbi:nuclear receptor-interacting protein 2 [Paramormyrops kingsleyae]|uniref:nuclear receptor-interacting protein 2 n=1 Tax=Paramormyrops kingsleyae TaxID=1676925 RepID=UPI003B96C47A